MSNILDSLNALSDGELHAVGESVKGIQKARDEERKAKALSDAKALKAKALADARAVLATAGLSLKDMGAKKPRIGKAPAYHVGRQYRHPADAALTWNGKGQKPGWLRELEGEGGKPLEAGAEPANDNTPKPAPVRKAG